MARCGVAEHMDFGAEATATAAWSMIGGFIKPHFYLHPMKRG